MDELTPADPPLARITLELIDNKNNARLDVEGDEKNLIILLSSAFANYPMLVHSFDVARRYFQILSKKDHN